MKKFQTLEDKVPTIGKTTPRFSNGWKNIFRQSRTGFQPVCGWIALREKTGWKPVLRSISHIPLPTIFLSLFLLTGCAVFQPRVPLEISQAPEPVLPAPPAFRAVQSVVFSFYGRSMTGIGVLALDREARTFKLSCMTPMGTKLFDLRMANDKPEVVFALPFFTEKEGFAEAVARDIARIYFDPEPPQVSRAWRKGDVLWVESATDSTTLAYGYTGVPPALIKKRITRGRALEARIEYLQFFEQDGFRCVGEAKLKSELYGYKLTVRTKELTIESGE